MFRRARRIALVMPHEMAGCSASMNNAGRAKLLDRTKRLDQKSTANATNLRVRDGMPANEELERLTTNVTKSKSAGASHARMAGSDPTDITVLPSSDRVTSPIAFFFAARVTTKLSPTSKVTTKRNNFVLIVACWLASVGGEDNVFSIRGLRLPGRS